jgi:manganese efflux pump family protein
MPMNLFSIFFIAIGLSMDAFAVSITSGFTIKQLKIRHVLIIASSFGIFQAIMPILGWYSVLSFSNYVEAYDHWLAFGLLFVIGCKMIYEALSGKLDQNKPAEINFKTLFILSIATSIDALAVGISFAFLKIVIIMPVIIIGCVTFAFSIAGVYIGNKLGHLFEKKIEIIGGIILILIGIKVLFEHL